jgi:hypothetical protein
MSGKVCFYCHRDPSQHAADCESRRAERALSPTIRDALDRYAEDVRERRSASHSYQELRATLLAELDAARGTGAALSEREIGGLLVEYNCAVRAHERATPGTGASAAYDALMQVHDTLLAAFARRPAPAPADERALILARREGYARALEVLTWPADRAREVARRHYPLPPREQPRVVADPAYQDLEYRVQDGAIEFRYATPGQPTSPWSPLTYAHAPTSERVTLWADLIARPTEAVPDPEDAP